MNDADIGYSLSPLAIAYLTEERRQTMSRDVTRTCEPAKLQLLLARHGLPMSPEIADFETHLGGWCSSHRLSAHGFGVYLSLQEGDGCSAVATEMRRRTWIFEGNRNEPDEDGDISPIWGTGYPRAFFLDRPLVPAGMAGLDGYFFLGEAGEVYLWVVPLEKLLLRAGSGRTMLERSGLTRHKNQSWFEVHICADVSALLVDALDVPRFEPACDHLFQVWAKDDVQVRLVPDYAPSIMGTHLACKNEGAFLHAMRVIKAQLNVDRIRIWKQANGIVDQRGIDSLLRSGIDCEILTGPGPGHGSGQYDVSLCEPKNWT